ncbi:hypothetical protein KSS87_004340 [Heliosperma pusillum]|nr:hypothetical protein KSS87_004340 [Heliosperma pusillum]
MALNPHIIPFTIFSPTPSTHTTLPLSTTTPSTTQLRFSRWNNANAEKFNNRTQQHIEDDLRRHRRFQSVLNITNNYTPATPSPSPPPPHKSTGTPSTPSLSSIRSPKSKYSKPERRNSSHPAFQKSAKRSRLPTRTAQPGLSGDAVEVKVSDVGGLTYVVPGAPFEFMYSYTEAPKGVKPLALREAAIAPFGPGTMPRPWTGRRPLPPSKKNLPEFDSFKPPPGGKKGVKSVQNPGPYLPGSGPKYVMTREEVLGEELTSLEVTDMIDGCRKTKRQLNMGRDGLTHNMLDNIHAHWKRRRVCKIKCKGVCTVDMDNVCHQLEEKTGGKIIYRRGGIVYLFRGRNYNYKSRPRYPLMLWKPISPVYPRLVKQAPEGLTLEEATAMRKRGRDLIPICKLGKNGVYVNLVKTVREAFEVCDLVRINCQGLNPSDYRKIGAKLKDLVPCVLISFEYEHVLMWRGKDWKPSFLLPESGSQGYQISESDRNEFLGPATSDPSVSDDEQESEPYSQDIPNSETCDGIPALSDALTNNSDVGTIGCEDALFVEDDVASEVNDVSPNQSNDIEATVYSSENESTTVTDFRDVDPTLQPLDFVTDGERISDLNFAVENSSESYVTNNQLQENVPSSVDSPCTEGVLSLLRQALESGSALVLDDICLDANVVYEKSVAFAQVAPPGPAFRHRPRKVALKKSESQESEVGEVDKVVREAVPEIKSSEKTSKERKNPRFQKAKDFTEDFLDIVPQGSLKIDELAKLLA